MTERPSAYDLAAVAFVRARHDDDTAALAALLADVDDRIELCLVLVARLADENT
jgi:hypothetical protein